MTINCIAIDDEPLALQLLSTYIAKTPNLNLLHTFEDAIAAMEYLDHHPIDLLFLDVDMPDMSGITLVEKLAIKPFIIFTTAHKHYALDGFELEAVDFLLKPFDFNRFLKAVDRVDQLFLLHQEHKELSTDACIYVYSEYKLIKVALGSIEYIEAMEDYIKIHLVSGERIITLSTLKGIMERLPQASFMRVHRSFIVSLDKIHSFNKKKLQMPSIEIAVGNSYLLQIRQKLAH